MCSTVSVIPLARTRAVSLPLFRCGGWAHVVSPGIRFCCAENLYSSMEGPWWNVPVGLSPELSTETVGKHGWHDFVMNLT